MNHSDKNYQVPFVALAFGYTSGLRVFFLALALLAGSLNPTVSHATAACRAKLASTPVLTEAAKPILDRIVGRIDFLVSAKSGNMTAQVQSRIDKATRKKAGNADPLLDILSNHIDDASPTAVRVEEKAVITEGHFSDFLSETQGSSFGSKFNKGKPLKWSMRDTPPPGYEFVTITEYGGHFILWRKTVRGKSSVVIKPRFRKYYANRTASRENLASYESSLGDLVALELKIAGLSGPEEAQFLEIPGVVFKPRIFVTDIIADKIKLLTTKSDTFLDELTSIKNLILDLKSSKDGSALNPAEHVHSMIEAIKWLLNKDDSFFRPQYVTTYRRTSYKFVSDSGEYQLTADRGVKVFPADPRIESGKTVSYLANETLFGSNDGEVFVELKSPQGEKQDGSALYKALISGVQAFHIDTYKMGSGKYSIARRAEESLFDSHLITTLLDEGTLFWLIKGTANLDSSPKEKDIINKGEVQIAYPFTTKKGNTYRVVFEYRPLNNLDTTKDAILDGIFVLDEFGVKIKSSGAFDEIIRDAYRRTQDEILALDFDGTVVPFKSRITNFELKDYQAFLTDFFQKSNRKIEVLSDITGSRNLHWRHLKIKTSNFVNWVAERTRRGFFGIFFASAGTLTTMAVYGNHPALDTQAVIETAQREKTAIVTPASEQLDAFSQINGFTDQSGNPAPLIAIPTQNGNYVFAMSSEYKGVLNEETPLVITNKGGQVLTFKVQKASTGSTYLILK